MAGVRPPTTARARAAAPCGGSALGGQCSGDPSPSSRRRDATSFVRCCASQRGVEPARARLLARGGIEYALAPLPPTERALALERCRDCNASLDTALTAELASALATVEDALANGDLAPGFPSLADAFVFPIVECAHACGAAPLSGSVAAPPRPATLAWRASLLEREAFAEVAGEIGRLWGVE